MEYRNSSGTHFGNDVAFGVHSSHGVELTGGSTGGTVRPASDDASAALNVRAKGPSGLLNLGTSTGGTVTIDGAALASASPFSLTGSSFSVVGASSINLSPTSTAGITIGNSSNQNPILVTGSSIALKSTHVNLNSSRTVIGASTTPVILFQRSRIDFLIPAMSSNSSDESVEVAVTGLTTNALCFIQRRQVYNSTITAGIFIEGYCSTAAALRLNIHNLSVSSFSGSTASADLFRIECPVAIP